MSWWSVAPHPFVRLLTRTLNLSPSSSPALSSSKPEAMPRHTRHRQSAAKPRHVTLCQIGINLLGDAGDDADTVAAINLLRLARREKAAAQSTARHGPRGVYDRPRSQDFFQLLMTGFTERQFRTWLRVSRETFWHLHSLIRNDPIFVSSGKRPQKPIHQQLAAYLMFCGGEAHVKVACVLSVAEGSIYNYVYRVGKAFRRIRGDHLAWPGPERRDFLSEAMDDWGFPGCLGSADGTLIRLQEMPLHNPYSYWCRKKFYALVIQATVDHRGIFTSYDFGWPGSVQDSRVFRRSDLWINRDKYFRPHEYILVDKGYPLTQFSIRPFNDEDLTSNPAKAAERKRWNVQLSRLRIFVEHAFGRMKGRFPILRCMPGRHIPTMCRLIESLMIVHNIVEELRDDPEEISGFNGDEEVDMEDITHPLNTLDTDELHGTGVFRRKRLVEYMKEKFE